VEVAADWLVEAHVAGAVRNAQRAVIMSTRPTSPLTQRQCHTIHSTQHGKQTIAQQPSILAPCTSKGLSYEPRLNKLSK